MAAVPPWGRGKGASPLADAENGDTLSCASGWSIGTGVGNGETLPYSTQYVVSIRSDGVPRVKFGARSLNVLGRDPLPYANTQPLKVSRRG